MLNKQYINLNVITQLFCIFITQNSGTWIIQTFVDRIHLYFEYFTRTLAFCLQC